MKKVINGKLYNTDTATPLASRCEHHGDFRSVDESLYRTKKGSYFLAGSGGPMSKYAVACDNGWSGGSDIIPITEEEARGWAERYCDADEYAAVFGMPEEA